MHAAKCECCVSVNVSVLSRHLIDSQHTGQSGFMGKKFTHLYTLGPPERGFPMFLCHGMQGRQQSNVSGLRRLGSARRESDLALMSS